MYCTNFFLEIHVEEKETLSHSMKMGVITLLYKKKGDKRLLKKTGYLLVF